MPTQPHTLASHSLPHDQPSTFLALVITHNTNNANLTLTLTLTLTLLSRVLQQNQKNQNPFYTVHLKSVGQIYESINGRNPRAINGGKIFHIYATKLRTF